MNLSEHLLNRDIKELGQMADVYQCQCNHHSKLELVQAIHHQILTKHHYQETIDHLPNALLLFFTYLLFQPVRKFDSKELVTKGRYVSSLFQLKESPRKWIAELMKRGWLFPVSSKFQVELEIPSDVHECLQEQFSLYWKQHLVEKRPRDGAVVSMKAEAMLEDLATFLTYVRDFAVPLTISGVMHKRQQHVLFERLVEREKPIEEKGWRFGYGRRYPNYPKRFALIYDFCFYQGYIEENEGGLLITASGIKYLKLESEQRERTSKDIYTFWLHNYKKPIPSLPFLIQFLTNLSRDSWLPVKPLFSLLQPWLPAYYYDDSYTLFKERVIEMLFYMGLAQVCSFDGEPTWIRMGGA